MPSFATPAIAALLAEKGREFVWAEIGVSAREREGFELRHVSDRGLKREQLKLLELDELRTMASYNAGREFRPLRSAPDLRRGWVYVASGEAGLEEALETIYPNSVSDWLAAHRTPENITGFREYTGRQTGMYRITQMLSEEQAAAIIRATCHPRFCLKQRRWGTVGAPPDLCPPKATIPCLEPCAILLETARKGMRIEQEEKRSVAISQSDWETIKGAVEQTLAGKINAGRAADFGNALNGRRLQLVLEKFEAGVQAETESPEKKA